MSDDTGTRMSDDTGTGMSDDTGRSDDTLTVTRNDEAGRYEIFVGDALGGYSEFVPRDDGRVIFPHTELDPAFTGRGLGSKLVAEAMKDAAARGETVVPVCPFVAKYLAGKPVDGLEVQWPKGART